MLDSFVCLVSGIVVLFSVFTLVCPVGCCFRFDVCLCCVFGCFVFFGVVV